MSLVRGSESERVIGNNNQMYLKDQKKYVKGNQKNWIQGRNEILADSDMFISAKNSYAVTSKTASLVGADTISVFGNDGTIGGKKVDFTGQTYMGHVGQNHLRVVQHFMDRSTDNQQKQCSVDLRGRQKKSKYAEEADKANSQSYAEISQQEVNTAQERWCSRNYLGSGSTRHFATCTTYRYRTHNNGPIRNS